MIAQANAADRRRYVSVLRSMTPEKRLRKALELTAMVRELAQVGLERRNPDLTPAELNRLVIEHRLRWHSKTS